MVTFIINKKDTSFNLKSSVYKVNNEYNYAYYFYKQSKHEHISITTNILLIGNYKQLDLDNYKNPELIKTEFSYGGFNLKEKFFFGARDKIGIKPFFYAHTEDVFVYSTSLKEIKNILKSVSVNKEYINKVLTGTAPLPDETFYKEIKRLPPAHWISYADGILEIKKYWESKPINNASQEQFNKLLVSAVKNRVHGEMGSELSGGIDSSGISGILASQNKSIFSFRHVMNDSWREKFFPFMDERQFSDAQVSYSKNIDIVNADSDGKGIVNELIHEMKIIGSPFYSGMSLFSGSLYDAAKEKGIDVLFSGFGGDELVSSKGSYLLNKLIQNKEYKKLRTLTNTRFFSVQNLKYYFRSFFPDFRLKRHWREEQLDNHLLKKDINKAKILKNDPATRTYASLNEFMLAKISGDTFLTRLEENGLSLRARGIEYTYPLLDVDLIECYLGLPNELKYDRETPRSIYKNAIKAFTPKEIYTRNDKTGATVPTVSYRYMNDYEKIKALLNTYKNGKASEFLDIDKMLVQLDSIRTKATEGLGKQRLDNRIFIIGLQMILYFDLGVLGDKETLVP